MMELKSVVDLFLKQLPLTGVESIEDTPRRVEDAWKEFMEGYDQDPEKILSSVFDSAGTSPTVSVNDIEFYSLCEHHLLPFFGSVSIEYTPKPGGKVVGLSKLGRLVDCYAKRLQIQERMTNQIAEAVKKYLNPSSVSVIIKAVHTCMCARGIKKKDSYTITKVTL